MQRPATSGFTVLEDRAPRKATVPPPLEEHHRTSPSGSPKLRDGAFPLSLKQEGVSTAALRGSAARSWPTKGATDERSG